MTRLVFYQNPYLDKVGLSGMWLGGKRQSPSLISKPLEPVGTLLNVGQFIKTIRPDRATSLGAREITLLERLPCLCSCREGTLHQMNFGSGCSEGHVFQYLYCQV